MPEPQITITMDLADAQCLYAAFGAALNPPAPPAEPQGAAVDVSISGDPFAPEPATVPESAQQPAQEPPAPEPVSPDPQPEPAATEPQSEPTPEPVPGVTPGHPMDAVTGEPLDLTPDQHEALAQAPLDPPDPALAPALQEPASPEPTPTEEAPGGIPSE
jgi:hypothetical protein